MFLSPLQIIMQHYFNMGGIGMGFTGQAFAKVVHFGREYCILLVVEFIYINMFINSFGGTNRVSDLYFQY